MRARLLPPLVLMAATLVALQAVGTVRPGLDEGAPLPVTPAPAPSTPAEPLPPAPEVAPAPEEPIRFLAWGDGGHGNGAQRATAQAAAEVCAREGCDFVLLLGDNVYPVGVRNVSDPQFEEKFERPYANLSLPFYVVLGNHDIALGRVGGAERDNGDFQVRYALRSDRTSDKWWMPARYYSIQEGPLQIVVLDLTWQAAGRADPAWDEAQRAWLRETWDEDASWRIAASHFPYVSNGRHGIAGRYDDVEGKGARVADFVREEVCGRADLYLSAHDHTLEWLAPVPPCGATEFVVSGAASEPRPLARNATEAYFARGEMLGFAWFEVTRSSLTGRFYDIEGNLVFGRALRRIG